MNHHIRYSLLSGIVTLVLASWFGCEKSSLYPGKIKRTAEGIVYEDCNGNIAQSRKIYLTYTSYGCVGQSEISKDSTLTDEYGHFRFEYLEDEENQSTTSYAHTLWIPNSTISLNNPNGHYNLYPNEIKMNAVIHLKFRNPHTASDTFFFRFQPTSNGFVSGPEQNHILAGPFHDTTLVMNQLSVGNSNDHDNGVQYSGFFRWNIGRYVFDNYYTGRDGYFNLTHKPCTLADTFVYYADPI